MKLKDVVAQLKEIRDQEVNTVNQREEPLVFEADRLSFLKFDHLIEKLEAEGERDFCEDDRVLLKDFLRERWTLLIQRTHADYFMNPHGRAAKVFRALAEYTSIDLFLVTAAERPHKQERWLSLMAPTLKDAVAAQHSNEQFQFRDYQLNSGMDDVVNVVSALNNVDKKNKNKNGSVDQSVIMRVKDHDDNAKQLANIHSVPQRNRPQMQATLSQRMRNQDKVVTATYAPKRNDVLKEKIQSQWVPLGAELGKQLSELPMETVDGLVAHIVARLPYDLELAPRLLGMLVFGLKDEVLDALLKADKLDRKLVDDKKNRVFIYLSIFNYVRQRKKQDDYKSNFGRYSKQDKLKIANSILDKLAAGVSLIAIVDYLNGLVANEKSAAVNGELGVLVKQCFLENPCLKAPEEALGYFERVKVSVAGLFGLFGGASPQPAPAPVSPNAVPSSRA
ncbi:MAG TPA: hypothetical protein VFU82_07810 [Gammaproteobacteria bacterium]|nr:hypothetical protein [Gammaproteobacteria bacterium]